MLLFFKQPLKTRRFFGIALIESKRRKKIKKTWKKAINFYIQYARNRGKSEY